MSNLLQRVIVALIFVPLIVLSVKAGGWWFFISVSAFALLSLYELSEMFEVKQSFPLKAILFPSATLLLYNFFQPFADQSALLAVILMIFSAIELFRSKGSALHNLGATALSLIYIILAFGLLIPLRAFDEKGDFVLLILFSVWAADTFGYFGGRFFGGKMIKQKLFEKHSPKKTWEGFYAGFAASIGVAIWFSKYLPNIPLYHLIIVGIIIGFFGPLGDLIESMFKRDSGMKDSSTLIPGHGGFFDRFDVLCFVSPLVFFYATHTFFK
ncbi:MAG: phosphatidate cytidylyltransferase [Chloroherpetonaceae bacterium]|nr:phosphatidate cytidylyltransferase [Chloroherpetonaceae bacterium]